MPAGAMVKLECGDGPEKGYQNTWSSAECGLLLDASFNVGASCAVWWQYWQQFRYVHPAGHYESKLFVIIRDISTGTGGLSNGLPLYRLCLCRCQYVLSLF